MCAKVASQTHLIADCSNDIPGLASPDRFHETIILSIEEDEIVLVTDDFRISSKILFQGIPDTGVDHNFLSFSLLLFFDPKSSFDILMVIQKMLNL